MEMIHSSALFDLSAANWTKLFGVQCLWSTPAPVHSLTAAVTELFHLLNRCADKLSLSIMQFKVVCGLHETSVMSGDVAPIRNVVEISETEWISPASLTTCGSNGSLNSDGSRGLLQFVSCVCRGRCLVCKYRTMFYGGLCFRWSVKRLSRNR